ncbi:MAG: type II secretion system protein GspD, partial [Kiritimatiellia bacterium]
VTLLGSAMLLGVAGAQQVTGSSPALAAEQAAVAEATTERAEIPGAQVKPAEASNLISVTLDDVELADVVRLFTRISGANIIVTPSNLTGRVTVNMTNVEWRPALESILEMHGLVLLEKTPGSGVYSILPKPIGAPEPMRVQTFFLKYATVKDVKPVVESMLAEGAKVSLFPSRNALVVRSTSANLTDVSKVIEEIDRIRDQVYIEAKFMELDDEAIKSLGIDWQVLESYDIHAANLNRSIEEEKRWEDGRADTISRKDARSRLDKTDERYDLYNDQYEERTITYEESPPGSGHYAEITYITPTRKRTDSVELGAAIASDISRVFTRTFRDVRTAVLGAKDFQLILSAFKGVTGVSIISNPKIIVANEEPAVIHIGETERPFISSVTPGQQGIAPVITYNPGEPVDTGVKLTVTPTVNTESNITVRIEPELTAVLKNAVAPNGQTYPIVRTKKIKTVFTLESGKTVAIGGLTETRDNDATKKVPLLGDIPIIGKYLFSHTRKEKAQRETIIFVTVGLASPATMEYETGMPEDAQLVHKQLIAAEAQKKTFQEELQLLRQAATAEESKKKAAPPQDK